VIYFALVSVINVSIYDNLIFVKWYALKISFEDEHSKARTSLESNMLIKSLKLIEQ
jgi:hypothetical protein